MRTRHARQGFLLITTLMVVSGLLVLSAVSIMRSATDLLVTNHFVASQQAFAVAEAGLDCAITQLRTSPDQNSASAVCTTCTPPTCAPGTRIVVVSAPTNNRYPLTSAGMAAASTTSTVTAEVQRTPPASPFQQALFGSRVQSTTAGIQLIWGAKADSYDSRSGSYGGSNQANDAEIRTNSSYNTSNPTDDLAAIVVVYAGSSAAYAYAPPGAEIEKLANITVGYGQKPVQSMPTPKAPTQPGGCIPLGDLTVTSWQEYPDTNYCATSITVNGGTLRFPNLQYLSVSNALTVQQDSGGVPGALQVGQGTIKVTGTLTVQNANSTFEGTDGRVDVYTHKLTVLSGTLKSANLKPGNLRVYQIGGTADLWKVQNGSLVYGSIYALDTNLSSGTSSIFGGVISGYCTLSGAGAWVHFDKALKDDVDWPTWVGPVEVTVLAQY